MSDNCEAGYFYDEYNDCPDLYEDDCRELCDCSDEEWDTAERTAKCWECGTSRSLSAEEINQFLRAQSDFEQQMQRDRFWDRVRGVGWSIRQFLMGFSRQPTEQFDDDIPF